MTFQEFGYSLQRNIPPDGVSTSLKALWYDAKGDWTKAHLIAQEVQETSGSWIHGYLHRKEGDLANASYWYSRAGKIMPTYSIDQEWEEIVKELLNREN